MVPEIDIVKMAAAVNGCYRKKIFRSEKNAAKKAAFHNLTNPPGGGKVFHAYFCEECFNYHIGRTSNPR